MSKRDQVHPALVASEDLFRMVKRVCEGRSSSEVINALCSTLAIALTNVCATPDDADVAMRRLAGSTIAEIRANWAKSKPEIEQRRAQRRRRLS
jgi:hypothetical protein